MCVRVSLAWFAALGSRNLRPLPCVNEAVSSQRQRSARSRQEGGTAGEKQRCDCLIPAWLGAPVCKKRHGAWYSLSQDVQGSFFVLDVWANLRPCVEKEDVKATNGMCAPHAICASSPAHKWRRNCCRKKHCHTAGCLNPKHDGKRRARAGLDWSLQRLQTSS